MELKECILDAYEEVMADFFQSEEYKKKHELINKMLSEVQEHLPKSENKKIRELIDLIGEEHSSIASESFVRGAVRGMALHNEVFGEKLNKN